MRRGGSVPSKPPIQCSQRQTIVSNKFVDKTIAETMRKHPANLCQSPRSKSRRNPSLKWRHGIRIISVEGNRTHNGRLITMGFWARAGVTGGRLKNLDSHHPEQKEKFALRCLARPGKYLSTAFTIMKLADIPA
jgi:hypothetical protein